MFSPQWLKNGLKRYGVAVALVLCALLLTLVVNPPRLASPIFLLAVILAAWLGGTGPGLLAALLATLAIAYFFLPPIYSFVFDTRELPQLVVFFLAAMVVSWWSAGRRRAEGALLRARDELEARDSARTADLAAANARLEAEITERKRAEEALRRSEKEFRAAIESIPAMVWSALPDGTADFFNRRWQDYTGLSLEQSLGWEWGSTVHADDAEQYFGKWRECITTGQPIDVEVRFRRAADGQYRWFQDSGVPLRDEQGNILKWYGIVTDLEDRKRAEEALRYQTLLLKTVTDNVSSMLYIVDAAGLGTFVNPALERITGYRAEELIGQVVHDKIHHTRPNGTPYPVSECPLTGAVRKGGTVCGEEVFIRKDGTFFPVRYAASPVFREGLPLGAVIEVQDLTETRAAEEELRKRAALLNLAHDAILVRDGQNRIVFWNHGAEKTYGWTEQEAIGRVSHELLQTRFPMAREDVDLALQQNGEWEGELRHLTRHGAAIVVTSRQSLRHDERGTDATILEINRDVTERKRAEAERLELEERLRRAEKVEAIGTLAGGIAHDFNNLLGAVLGYGELAQRKAREGNAIGDELEQVIQAGNRGKRLVEHILAFSRSGVGNQVAVHVQSVVTEALALLVASLPQGVRLEHTLAAGDAAVLGDATQLHQVAMNLCTNAVQAMARGGVVTVTLERVAVPQQRTLSHGMLEPGVYVRLAVSDTGSGIARAALERIFDPFFTTKGVGKGTGLGLSLVHGIVAESRGAIDVSTREGEGTTFTVWLPCSGETAVPAAEDMAELPQGNGESVMIVDDERPLVRLAEETLAQLGYDPAGFESSVAALEAFRAEPQRYDAVLTDQTMPELTGTELAREIRQLRPEVPIVLMSGYKGAQLTELAQAAGVREILHKPLVSRDIAEALAHVLPRAPDRGDASDSVWP